MSAPHDTEQTATGVFPTSPPRAPIGPDPLLADPATRRRSVDRDRLIAQGVGLLRVGIGGALLVAPGFAGRLWVGPHGGGPGARVFARAIGARDVALGLRTLADARAGRPVVRGLRIGVAADAADAAATLLAARELTTVRRYLMPAIATAVAVLGSLVTEEVAADEAAAGGARS